MSSVMNFLILFQAVAGLFALVVSYWIARSKSNKTKRKGAPQPSGAWPLIGHLHRLGAGAPLFRTLGDMADEYGPAFTIRLGMHRNLIVSSREVAEECFTTNDKVLATRPSIAAGKYLGYDYAMFGFAPYGPYWREIRKIATLEVLSNRRLQLLKHIRAREIDMCVKELHNMWEKNSKQPIMVDMKQWFGDLTLNVVAMMVTGKQFRGNVLKSDESETRRFRKGLSELLYLTGVFVASDALPFLKWMDLGGYEAAMRKTAKVLDSVMTKWLDEHKVKRLSGDVGVDQDFMDVMLSMVEEGNISGYDPDTIVKATCLAIILGGTDTTSITISWITALLLNNRHVLKKAQDELDTHVGKNRNVEESDIEYLVYLQAIIKETMRLYPAAPLSVPHEAMEDCQIAGFHVPAGTRLMVNLWKLQRDPREWSDPLEFRPERFLTSHAHLDVRGQKFEYIPFGSGRRSCPGISFALQVMHLTVARLVHGFDITTPENKPVDMAEGLGLNIVKATPLQVLLTPRLAHELYA